jgi:hypothetical protein
MEENLLKARVNPCTCNRSTIRPRQKLIKKFRWSRQDHMKVYATRHTFATNFYRQTRDIKPLAEALGTTEEIALKYAKLVGQTVVDGINKIDFFDDEKVVLKQVN